MSRQMKDSGIEWIGEIPETWKVVSLKRVKDCDHPYPIGDGDHGSIKPEHYQDEGVPYIRVQNLSWGGDLLLDDVVYISEMINDANEKSKLRPHDILIAKTGGTIGKTGIIPDNIPTANTTSSVGKITVSELESYKYVFYLLSSDVCYQQMWDKARQKSAQPGFNIEDFVDFKIPLPEKEEQERIAGYLDQQCAHIDAVIEKTKASIEEYKKLKQAVITQAVTKGIRGDRPMKASGIEWIGEIPADWEVRRIKTLFELRDEKNYLPLEEVNLISLYTDLGVVQHADLEKTTGNKASNADGYKRVYEDDIVVNIILCWMGAIGRSAYEGVTSPAYDIYSPKNDVNSKYYHHYFRTTGFSGDCFKRGRGIMLMRWRTYSDQFRDIKVAYPPIEEQQEIIDFLDKKCVELDKIILRKEGFLSELESYKKSLIYEYVTGKKEVPVS